MARILLVDDEESVLRTIRLLLMSEGHEVVPISDSAEAVKLIRSDEQFDLLLSDIRMAPIDGMEVLKLAREVRPDMGIIVLSAYCSQKVMDQAASLGCQAYVRKPFTIDEVLGAVRKALEQ